MTPSSTRVLWLLAPLCLAACASFGNFAGSGEGELVFGRDADSNIELGNKEMIAKNYADAARFYEYVKTKFPYLEAAKLAELRLGDADFERERYTEARDRYQNFVRLHPTHAKVDYAAYRGALTHYKEIPSDFFILPPSVEKDQAEVRSALSSMVDFTRAYPDSKYMVDADKVIVDVKRRLAEHELYVADFYAKRDRWPAVVVRLETITKNYLGTGYEERVYFGLYDAFHKLNNDAKALDSLRAYVSRYPDDAGAKKAKAIIAAAPATPAPAPAPKDAPKAEPTPAPMQKP